MMLKMNYKTADFTISQIKDIILSYNCLKETPLKELAYEKSIRPA
jgi:hypothetical protein